jgi:hypothetical protein
MRTLAQLCPVFCRLSSSLPQLQNKARIRCRAAVFPKKAVLLVTMSRPLPENCCSTWFITAYKRLAEGGRGAYAFCFFMGKAFSLLAFECRRLMEGKLLKGELLKGKELLKGNELLKGKCWGEIAEGESLKGNCHSQLWDRACEI